MQALEKIINSDYWITIVLVIALVFVFLLKGLNSNRLKTTALAFFNNSFVQDEADERTSFFKGFNLVLFVFLTTVISLLLYIALVSSSKNSESGFLLFGKVFFLTNIYFLAKWFLEYLISILFLIRTETRFFLVSKSMYLYATTFILYIAVILYAYTNLNIAFLSYFALSLFFIRFVFHSKHNKKLILSQLFYFILYLCAFEIAPLFVLFKLMF